MEPKESKAGILKSCIATWLAVTRNAEVPVGLEEEEAASRARDLFQAILEKRISPDSVVLDDEMKQILSVLISQLADSIADPESRLHQADAVYQFIRRLAWAEDAFGEKDDLLLECAEIGWGAIGLTIGDVIRRRLAGEGLIPFRRTDPNFPLVSLRPAEALGLAEEFLAVSPGDRSDEARKEALSNPDVLMAILGSLEELRDTAPRVVFEEATSIYEWLKDAAPVGVFDERDYFVGQSAYLAGTAARFLGFREEAARWLDRAESSFRHTLNPAPSMANVAYTRLSLAFQIGRYDELLELVPSVRLSFERLGMAEETAKCLLLEAMTLKKVGRAREGLSLLQPIRESESSTVSASLKGRILSEIGDLYQTEDRFDEAMSAYQQALQTFGSFEVSPGRADLKAFVGEAYRIRGKSEVALDAFRAAVADYVELGLENRVAYLHMYVAEILLSLDRPREAEWEILAALPTIEEQKMVPEGFAAVALLKESVRRRKTDPNALRELREHLQKSN